MSDNTKIWELEDDTGKVYKIEGPIDATPDELFEAVSQLSSPVETKAQAPAAPQSPTEDVAGPVPVSASDVDKTPSAVLNTPDEEVATRTLEEVPGAREHLENLVWSDKPFEEVRADFESNFPDVRLADNVSPAQLAEIRAFAQTPQGRQFYSQNSAVAPVNRETGIADPDTPDSITGEFFQSAERALANMANTVTGAAGLGADLVGADGTAEQLLDTYLEKQAAIQQNYPSGAGQATEIDSLNDAGMWGASVLGELLPQLTSSMGAGAVGGAITRKTVERGVRDMVEDQIANGMTREAAEELAASAIRKKIMQGQIAGAGAVSEIQETGSVYGDTYGATGERKPWTSLLVGTAAASLDTILPARLLGKIGGGVGETALTAGLVKRLGKEGASAFLTEGGTEALQTIIEQLPAGKSINWNDVIESAIRGGFGGGTAGTAVGVFNEARASKPQPDIAAKPYPEFDGPKVAVPTAKQRRSKQFRDEISQTSQTIADRINHRTAEWENAPQFTVENNFSNIEGIDRNAIGAIVGDKVVINAENVLKQAKARNVAPEVIVDSVTFHEGLGHHGLQQQFGEDLDNKLLDILSNSEVYRGRVEKWIKKNPKAYEGDPNQDIRALEEILAERSERGQLPASITNQFKNMVKDFGRRIGLNMEYSTREVETILGMAHAAVVSGKGRDVRANGYKFMNIGPKAVTHQEGRIRAQIAAAQGKTPDEIYAKTKWWKDQDGGWRTRMSDSDSGLFYENADNPGDLNIDHLPEMNKGSFTLDQIFHHPKLYEAYPRLAKTIVARNPGHNLGSYHPSNRGITLNPEAIRKAGEDIRTVLLHEIQHAIQHIEGWARGGNPETALQSAPLKNHEIEPAAERILKERVTEAKAFEAEIENIRDVWKNPDIKQWRRLFDDMRQLERSGLNSPEYKEAAKAYFDFQSNLRKTMFKGAPKDDWQFAKSEILYGTHPQKKMLELENELRIKDAAIDDLRDALDSGDLEELRTWVEANQAVKREAYDWLMGEIESRETEGLSDFTQEELDEMPRGVGAPEGYHPDYMRITGANVESAKYEDDRRIREQDRRLRNRARTENAQEERRAADRFGIDPESIGLPPKFAPLTNKYMMLTDPDKVEITPEEIAAMTPEELMESDNAMNILEKMTEGYTPIVMSLDDLKKEAEDRGLPASRIKSVGAGEIVKRLYMYDIAMEKLHDRVTTLYEKLQSGNFSQTDRANYLKTVFKMNELAGRIFEDQGEVGRALAAMKSIQFTYRRVKGVQETIAQIKQGSPFEALNDPDEFYKFALSIQDQIEAGKAKAKEKGAEFIGNAINLPRALMSSMDFSAPLRQGLFLIHKAAWWRSFFNMFRYAGSKRAYDDLMESITARPSYHEMMQGNLALSNLGTKLSQREEAFMSAWAERLPIVGKLVAASERAYVGFLNKLRADVFDQLLSKLPEQPTKTQLRDIAAFVNAASGRGNLTKSLQSSTPLLNGLFFSPRLMASRIKMTTVLIDPRTYTTMDKVARKEYIKSIMSVGSLALLVTSLLAMGGAEVEKDPRSADFGKVKYGNTRYDILGGEGQYITLAARLVRNSYKTTDGKVKPYGTKYGQANRFDALTKFLTNKASPIPSFVIDYLRGVDPVGKPFKMDEAIVKRFIPMFIQDVMDNIKEEGVEGVAKTAPGILGVGVQTYSSVSLDTDRDLEPPTDFEMEDAEDGEYDNATALDGTVTLDDEAQKEWGRRLNFYYHEWMKDETSSPEWKTMTDDERREIIAEVRRDARKEAKLDMLEILGLVSYEEEE